MTKLSITLYLDLGLWYNKVQELDFDSGLDKACQVSLFVVLAQISEFGPENHKRI